MFDVFGEFDSAEEINMAAAGLLEEGDIDNLRNLAKENGILEGDCEDYIDGEVDVLTTPLLAAIGKIEIEAKDLKPYGIMEDWINYIKICCQENEDMAVNVRKKGKNIKGCIAKLLKWSFDNMKPVDKEIMEAAGVKQACKLGIPSMAESKKIIKKYYLG